MGKEQNMLPADEYWKTRTLCSDEGCIGVIGPDGRCKECGKKFEGKLPAPTVPAADETEAEIPDFQTESRASAEPPAESQKPDTSAPADSDWENRRLCSDENCIGVIGPDGRCKECGKPFKA